MEDSAVELAEGRYTGQLKQLIETDHFIFSTTHYITSNCNDLLHHHKNSHLCFLYQGLDLECKKDFKPYQRTAGELYFYQAGEEHKTLRTLKDSKNINVEFKLNTLKKRYTRIQVEPEHKNPRLTFQMTQILGELLTDDSTTADSLELLGFQFLKWDEDAPSLLKPQWVSQMDAYLNDRWADKFSLIELAEAIGVHPITISKNFRRYYSYTYGEYRRMLKIQHSIPLIKNRRTSLAQIAYTCGFADQSHFIRNFKKYSGFLPKDFRRL